MHDFDNKKFLKNFSISSLMYVFCVLANFVSKTIFMRTLGAEWLGVRHTISSIVEGLAIADLGMEDAFMYFLYKPVREDNRRLSSGLLKYYQKCLRIVCIFVLCIGLCIVPFLDSIIHDFGNKIELQVYFIVYLVCSLTNFLFGFRSIILTVYQKVYVIRFWYAVTTVVGSVVECTLMLAGFGFSIYFSAFCIRMIIFNVVMYVVADNELIKECEDVSNDIKVSLKECIRDMFVYRIARAVIENTDNVLISVFSGVGSVGRLSNYNMITKAMTEFLSSFITALTPSVGNHNASVNGKQSYYVFGKARDVGFVLYGVFSIVFYLLIDDFVMLWIGKEFCIDGTAKAALAVSVFVLGMHSIVDVYRKTTDVFKKTKWVAFCSAILNVIISIVAGYEFGVAGVIFGTVCAGALTNFWYEPFLLYRDYFRFKFIRFVEVQVCYAAGIALALLSGKWVYNLFNGKGWVLLFERAYACCVVVIMVLALIALMCNKIRGLNND